MAMEKGRIISRKAFITACGLLLVVCHCVKECRGQPLAIDMRVQVTFANSSELHFDTGLGIEGAENRVEIDVYDRCSFDAGIPQQIGFWFPESQSIPVDGIPVDVTGVNAPNGTGPGSLIRWEVKNVLLKNTLLCTEYNSSHCELKFCVKISLYTDGILANWDEVDVFMMHNTQELGGGDLDNGNIMGLLDSGIELSSSEAFFRAYEFNYTLPGGALRAYFCDPVTHQEEVGGAPVHLGSIVAICFNVDDGQRFEVERVSDLYVGDTSGFSGPDEAVIVTNSIGDFEASPYVNQYCETNHGNAHVRTCIVSFLLSARFFGYKAVTLAGYGAIRLRLEDRREMMVAMSMGPGSGSGLWNRRKLGAPPVAAGFLVNGHHFKMEANPSGAARRWSSSQYFAGGILLAVIWEIYYHYNYIF